MMCHLLFVGNIYLHIQPELLNVKSYCITNAWISAAKASRTLCWALSLIQASIDVKRHVALTQPGVAATAPGHLLDQRKKQCP